MRYSNIQTRKAAQVLPVICATCFIFFAFIYVYLFQSDFISQEQYYYSHGVTSYNPLLGAIIITLLLTFVGGLLTRFLTFPLRCLALAWVVPSYLLGLLCSLSFPELGSDNESRPIWFLFLLPFLYLIVVYLCHVYRDTSNEYKSTSAYLAPNLFILFLSFVMVIYFGNSHDNFHHELRYAQMIEEGKWDEAMDAMHDAEPTPKLNQLKVYVLTCKGQLGESLFSYPLCFGSQTMLRSRQDSSWVFTPERKIYNTLGMAPAAGSQMSTKRFAQLAFERDTTGNRQIADFLLTTCLMDKDLDRFAYYYPHVYDSISCAPRYFREAAVLYNRKHPDACLQVRDDVSETNCQDFLHLMNSNKSADDRFYICRDMYADTYWFYYFFVH